MESESKSVPNAVSRNVMSFNTKTGSLLGQVNDARETTRCKGVLFSTKLLNIFIYGSCAKETDLLIVVVCHIVVFTCTDDTKGAVLPALKGK